jgi:hypothetical protein
MAYRATVLPVMIASPSDVPDERNIVRDALHEWNDIHSVDTGIVLLPVGWETHSSPSLSGRPQQLINERVLDQCDLLIGVFWTRLGTPTGEAESGTAEEIRRHVEEGKPAMVYFSSKPVAPETFEPNQYEALNHFKEWCQRQGLTEGYDSIADFSEKIRRQIRITLRDEIYFSELIETASRDDPSISEFDLGAPLSDLAYSDGRLHETLSEEAQRLLKAAAEDPNGTILSMRFIGGQAIETNGVNFASSSDRRTIARWEAALDQLVDNSLIVGRGYKGEVFEMTALGYEVADKL